MNVLLVLLLAISGGRGSNQVTVDKIEFNTSLCYSVPVEQVIFWRWNAEYRRYDVRSFVRTNGDRVYMRKISVIETKDGVWIGQWFVRSKIIVHTTTDDDPEFCNQKLLDDRFREHMPWERF